MKHSTTLGGAPLLVVTSWLSSLVLGSAPNIHSAITDSMRWEARISKTATEAHGQSRAVSVALAK